ncbi:MAG: hypothetical protein JKY52_19495, partial [Flavobacteriales bacterium]|nr:hypothetical protein [Flavobacteriales bacterium]
MAAHFGEKFNTVIEIQGVDIAFFNKVILEGLYIEDLHRDTLLYISKLAVGIRSIDRDIHKMVLDEIVLNHGVLNIRKYKGETVLNYKFLMAGQQGPGTPKPTWEFDVRTMDLRDLNFSYVDENRGATKSLMDLKNLHVSSFNAYLNESKWINNTLITQIEKLSLKEKSGFVIDNLSGKIKSSPVGLTATKLMIVTPMSSLGGELSLKYTGYEDYKHFIDSVRIQADLSDTKVNLRDLSFFAPALIGLDETVQLSGSIQGTISKLKGKNIDLSYGEDTRFRGNLSLTGLPNFQETFIRFNVKKFSTSQKDLARLPAPPFDSGRIWKVPRYIRNLGRFNFVGDFTGFYNDFVAYGICESGLGVLVSDVSLTYNPITDQLHYEGQVSSSSFDVGRLLDAEKNVGVADFDINITGDGLNKNTAKAELDGLIKGITLKDYYYQNVELKGELQDKRFSGYLMAKDENLDFVFNGEIDYSASPPKFVFVADVLGANLDKLNLTTTLENPVFSVKVESNFFGKGIDDIQGEILLRDLKYRDANLQSKKGFYPIGDISLMASEDNGKRKLQLHSEFVDADLEGAFNLQGLAGALFHSLHDMLPNSEHLSNLVASTKNHEH